jgi:hypothetical protein
MTVMGTGIFEQLHMLMTFEDTLMNLLIYPDEMLELIDRSDGVPAGVHEVHRGKPAPRRHSLSRRLGSERALFMKPETWRDFFWEPLQKLYDYLHSEGVLVVTTTQTPSASPSPGHG